MDLQGKRTIISRLLIHVILEKSIERALLVAKHQQKSQGPVRTIKVMCFTLPSAEGFLASKKVALHIAHRHSPEGDLQRSLTILLKYSINDTFLQMIFLFQFFHRKITL